MISESRLALLARKAVQRAIAVPNETSAQTATMTQAAAMTDAATVFSPADNSAGDAQLARLARSLRDERKRGRAGHWSYDLNRHLALTQAYEAEKKRLHQRQR